MRATVRTRLRMAIVAVAPAVLLAGFAYHPYISPPTDEAAVAAAAASDTLRWQLAHVMIAIGYGLVVLAFLAVRSHLREVGEERWSALALPPIVLGSVLFVILTGMEMALAAVAETGGDAQAVQAALFPWFVPSCWPAGSASRWEPLASPWGSPAARSCAPG
jgi:xanthine/uracil permease